MARCRSAMLAAAVGLWAVACDATRPREPAVFVAPPTLRLEDGQSSKLTATLRNPKSRAVRWSSSNPAVAKVDAVGNVTAVVNGLATISVKMELDTTVVATVPVTVVGPAVATVSLNLPELRLYIGLPSYRLTAQLRTIDGRPITGRTVTWASADPTVADVSATGLVRPLAPGGPLALTATSEGRTATTMVRVAHSAELCPFINTLPLGQKADGRLSSGDCEYTGDASYVDVYEFTLAALTTVQIDMASADLDAYIGLFEPGGRFIAEDDNSGGGRNSQIVKELAPGKYRIWANTLDAATAGSYTLTVTQR